MPRRKPAAKTGRPSKLADEQARQTILRVLRAGGSRTDAAIKAHVTPQTIKNLAKRDPAFLQVLLEAELDGKLSLMVTVRESAKAGDWKAAAWMLERKYWSEYAKRQPDVVTAVEMSSTIRQLVDIVLEVVPSEHHERVHARVNRLVASFDKSDPDR